MFDNILKSYLFVIFGDLLVSKVKIIIMITIVNNSNKSSNYVLFICRILLGEFIELSLDYGETAESS